MTEADARERAVAIVGREGAARLEHLAALVLDENGQQNLIARSTEPIIWRRHLLDSVQLLRLAPPSAARWLDVGTGGGFPGLALAAVDPDRSYELVEPRRRRADFLGRAAALLRCRNVTVHATTIERVRTAADVISGRAVSAIDTLIQNSRHCAMPGTVWLLPAGRSASTGSTLPDMVFHVEPSVTDPASMIVTAKRA